MSWPTLPLRRLFRILNGGTPTADEANWDGEIPWATPVDLGEADGVIKSTRRTLTRRGAQSGSCIAPSGSLLVSTRAPIGYVARAEFPIAFNQGCRALVPAQPLDARFFYYQLASMTQQLQAAGQGSTFLELSSDALAGITVIVPPLEEQRRIADFLERETNRLNRIEAARRSQLTLIEERSVTRAFDAVRGANEPGGRRYSGLRWLGDIPDSWIVAPVSSQFEVQLGKMLNQEHIIGRHLRPYLRNTNVQWDRIDTDDLLMMDFPPAERRRYQLLPGDLLVCEGGEPGRAAIWDGSVPEIYYQKALHRLRSRGASRPRWLYYCLRVATALNVFAVEGNTTTIAHLTREQLNAHRFPFPEPAVQDRLVRELDEASIADQELVAAIERQLNLLAERRRALITAAVTGQIDVTAAGRAIL